MPAKTIVDVRFTVFVKPGEGPATDEKTTNATYAMVQRVFFPSQLLVLRPDTLPIEFQGQPPGANYKDGIEPMSYDGNSMIILSADYKATLDAFLRSGNGGGTAAQKSKKYIHIFLVSDFQAPPG